MEWKKIKEKLNGFTKETVVTATALSTGISEQIAEADWFKKINEFSSEVSKAMDAKFIQDKIVETVRPTNHRILDGGHDFFSSIAKAQEIGEQNDWSSTKVFEEWAKAYFTDLSSPAGLPILGQYSDNVYKFLKELGVSDTNAADLVTLNGREALENLIGGSISAVALIFAWNNKDKENFSKSIGFILVSGTAALSPVTVIVAVIALAFGYNTLVNKEAVAKGALSSGLVLAVSAVIPGPVLLGVIPALILSIYLNKKLGKDFKPIESSLKLLDLLKSEEFKKVCSDVFLKLSNKAESL